MSEEDVYIVIIGDEDANKHIPFEIKEEVLDEEELKETVENLLTTAVENGEVFDLDFNDPDISRIKEEPLDVEVKSEHEDDHDFIYEEYITGDVDSYMHKTPEDPKLNNENKIRKTNLNNKNVVVTKSEDENYDSDEYLPDDSLDSDNDSSYEPQHSKLRKPKKVKYGSKKIALQDNSQKDNEKRPRKKMLTAAERRSFVKELKEKYSELQDNKALLVNCLFEVMKSQKPPPLPDGCLIAQGSSYECARCGWLNDTLPAASRHYQEKHGERYLHCFACGVDFRSKTNLYKHEKRCDSPDAVYVLQARARFVGRKGRSRPFISDLPKTPPKKSPAQPRFPCPECSAKFCSRVGLQAHELLHRGERPYLCPHCPSAYTSQTTLTRHLQRHGTQKYICHHCSKEFKVKAALVLHMDTHRTEKKFPCSHCPKRYAQKAALMLHVNRDHLKLPLPCACKLCPNRYARMSVLKDHMRKVHGMIIMTRKMFFKKLPMLTSTQLEQAKVVLKQELDNTSGVIMDKQEGSLQFNLS